MIKIAFIPYYYIVTKWIKEPSPDLPFSSLCRITLSLVTTTFLHPHPPHGALLQLGIIAVLGLGITEHVCEAGAAVQVTEEVGFEVEHFQVDIHLISYAL